MYISDASQGILIKLEKSSSTSPSGQIDKLGVRMIYATKPGGDEWYISDGDLKNDSRVEVKGKYKKAGDFHNGAAGGGNPPTFRVVVAQKNGFDPDKTQALAENRKEAAEKGYLQDPDDWTNS